MKLNLPIHTGLALLIIIPMGGILVLQNSIMELPVDENRTVYLDKTEEGYQLIRNGEPFFIQGAGGESNFRELAEIGGNTIRFFNTTNLKNKLDEAHEYNLAVIVEIYLPAYNKSYYSYDDEDENLMLIQKVRDLVYEHKDHPALLIWNLGNEINYPVVIRKNNFIKTFNELVSLIQDVDPNHPVSTSIIGVGRKTISSIYIHSPEIDLISFNTFGNTRFIKSHLAQTSFLFGSRPYFFSEYGPNGPWESSTTSWGAPIEETSTVKSERIRTRFETINGIDDGAGVGSLMFYWGNKLERTHTWFSLFKDGYKSESIIVIESMWNKSDNTWDEGRIDYMLVNDKRAHENVIFAPGELSHAEIFFHNNYNDSVRIEWEIYPEAWYSDTNEVVLNNYEPIDSFINFENSKTTFHAPIKEGPYRIFAYIYNKDGFFATTNTPFYVLGIK